jgi:organic radical activating enzyme
MKGKLNYYRRLAKLYRSYLRRDVIVPTPPLRLWLEISARCNLRCPFCPNKDLDAALKGDMPWPLLQKVADQAQGFALEMNLHHRGETLLHPQAGRFIRYAAGKGIYTRLHSNGTLLDKALSAEIIDSDLQRLSISFDGFNAAAYEKNRPGASFAQVTGNIETFLSLRRQRGKRTPRLAIEVMDLSQAQMQKKDRLAFAARFKKLGLDELVIKKPHNWAGHLGSPGGQENFSACTFPWNALLVLFNGDVLACAQDFFGRNLLGNAGRESLPELWNGPAMQKLRRSFAVKDMAAFPACAACDRIRRPTLGGVPKEYLKRLARMRMP